MAFVCQFPKLPSNRTRQPKYERLHQKHFLKRKKPPLLTIAALDIAVVGSGTAGLTAALLLQRQGHNVSLFERAQKPRAEGYGVLLRGCALDSLQQHGVTDVSESISLSGAPLRGFSFRNHANIELSTRRTDDLETNLYRCVRRADVIEALWQPFERAVKSSKAEFQGGKRLINVVEIGEKVEAHFEDGTNWKGDALIGADGIKSQAACHVAPQRRLHYLGDLIWRGISEDDTLAVDGIAVSYQRKNGVYAIIYDIGSDSNGISLSHWGVFAESEYPEDKSERNAVKQREILYESLKLLPTDFVNLVTQKSKSDSAMQGSVVTYSFDIDPLPNYVRGRVALIGDAAHAMASTLAWGMASGIDDGIALANNFEKENSVLNALKLYEESRLPVTHGYQTDSRNVSIRGRN